MMNEADEMIRYYPLESYLSVLAKYKDVLVNLVLDCCREEMTRVEKPMRSVGDSSASGKV